MDIKVIDHQGKEVVEEQVVPSDNAPQTTDGTPFIYQQVAEMFDLTPKEAYQYRAKIQTLVDYAKQVANDSTDIDIKWAIRNLALKVGTPPLGERMINYLAKYAHLKTDQTRLQKEIENYESAN